MAVYTNEKKCGPIVAQKLGGMTRMKTLSSDVLRAGRKETFDPAKYILIDALFAAFKTK